MYACSSYELNEAFEENIEAETRDNVRRIRHHACLGLWCGNNEMETQTLDRSWKPSQKQFYDYIKLYEHIIPKILRQEDPHTFYWPSSPSSGGNFDNPWDENRGDTHYWDVWHGNKPFTEYRKFRFRYLSEFGFQSFPCLQTVESFTEPEDRNIFSRVMEMHQRNVAANGKILNYLSATYLYPGSFDLLLYASQLLQMEAIRYGVEHFRRHRGHCMGTVVWQLNDIWPVASWASIDYYGRWKPLHYAQKRMFAPVLLSCQEMGELSQRPYCIMEPGPMEVSAQLCVSNETLEELRNLYPEEEFYFILGADCLFAIEGWKAPERIFGCCTLVAAVRGDRNLSEMEAKRKELMEKFRPERGIVLLPFLSMSLSSTEIRERVRKGQSVRYLVPDRVLAYIREKGFYQS